MLKQIEELIAANKRLEERLSKLEPKKPDDQEIASWAEIGYAFVTTDRGGETISDGRRPEDHVTRQEVWTMLERVNRLV